MLPKKTKNEKKIKYPIPPFQTARMKKNSKKKSKSNLQNLSRADMCQRGGSFPSFPMAGMRKTTKKKPNKNRKWVNLENKSDRGSDLEFFWHTGSE